MTHTASPGPPAERAAHHTAIAARALPAAALFQVVLLSAGWGGNAPALRYSLGYLSPFAAAGVRFLIGMVVIALFAWLQGVSLRARREEWRPLLWMGLLFTVQICLLNLGSARTAASRQALLINSYPLFVPLLAHLFLPGERLSWNKLAGTLLAFTGVLVLFGERALAGGALAGDLLIAGSAVLLAGKAVYTSSLVRTNHPYQVLFWQMVCALPCFFGLSLAVEPRAHGAGVWSAPVIASLLYQGIVVAGLCFVGWTSLLRAYSPSRLSVGFFLTPVFGALFSHLILGEAVTGGLVAAGGAILLGLLMVNRK